MNGKSIKSKLDWGDLVPLRLMAQAVAEGVWAGGHKSARKGSGVEFGGHRDYVPGDDLRWLDRHALMRHGKLMVRQFETETDRTLWIVLDASRSMAFRSERARAAKLAYAALIAAALAKVALSGGDPVGLEWLGGKARRPLKASAGRDAFERAVAALEAAEPGGSPGINELNRTVARVARGAPRGAVIVLISDLLDLPEASAEAFTALGTRNRTVLAIRLLDPTEAEFPFDEPVRLRASEGNAIVETDGRTAREGYLLALNKLVDEWDDHLIPRGGRVIRASTSDDPVEVVRSTLLGLRGRLT